MRRGIFATGLVAALLLGGCTSTKRGTADDGTSGAVPGGDAPGAPVAGGGAVVGGDRDGDGVIDTLDRFPDDASRFTAYSAVALRGLSSRFTMPLALNERRDVVGISDDPSGTTAGVYWSLAGGTATPPVALRPLPGNANSAAYDVSEDRIAVGESDQAGSTVAVIWTAPGGSPTALPLGVLAPPAVAYAIHGARIVGEATTAAGNLVAVLWSSTSADAVSLGTLPGGTSSAAYATAGDWVVGESSDRDGNKRGAVWSLSGAAAGSPRPLAPLAGHVTSVAYGVNAKGQIVGESQGPGGTHAVAWSLDAGGTPSAPVDLGAGGANAISQLGRIAGGRGTPARASVWASYDVAIADVIPLDAAEAGTSYALDEFGTVVGSAGPRGFAAMPY
jgi:uncharacterized membrane protein